MSIRRKLFFGFVAAAAVPLVAVALLARLYVQRERADIDQRFVDEAQRAFRRLDQRACDRLAALRESASAFVSSLAASRASGSLDHEESPDPVILMPSWDGEEAAREAAREKRQAKSNARRELSRIKQQMEMQSRNFQARYPAVIGVQLVVDGTEWFSSLARDFDLEKGESWHLEKLQGAQLLEGDGRMVLMLALDGSSCASETNQLQIPASRALVEIDRARLFAVEKVNAAGRALYLAAGGRPFVSPDELESLVGLPLSEAAARALDGGESGSVTVGGRRWRAYAGTSAERSTYAFDAVVQPVALIAESELYAAVARFQLEVAGAMLLSLLVALGLSYWLSGRFTESVENLKRGVDALSRGEFAALEKSSGDELGGELVESMNRMAGALAERTRKEEIESWRRLVRVLSHEINNTLGPVKSVATTVRDQLAKRLESEAGAETAEDLRTAFRLIVDRVDSLSSFISGYAVLAKLPPPERAPADLNEVVRGAVTMLREPAAERQIRVDEVYDPAVFPSPSSSLARPSFDQQQVERVAINLIKNAVEAAARRVQVKTDRRGDLIELAVEDDGQGIAPDARAHLFVPYYTTKPGGSGIGLALARQIVLGHGGTIGAEDRPGGGTIVRVVLPTGALI